MTPSRRRFDKLNETSNPEVLSKSDKMKLFCEYLTTYRSVLVMNQGTTEAPNYDEIKIKAKEMADEAFDNALNLSGLSDII